MHKLVIVIVVTLITSLPGQTQELIKKSVQLSTGIRMAYIDRGDPRSEQILLFLHGFTDTSRSFDATLNALNRLLPNARLIAPDLRGHGNSSMPDPSMCAERPEECFTISKFREDIISLLDQNSIKQVYVVGHSMGSLIAQQMAVENSDRVKGVVLIGTFVNGISNAVINDYLQKEVVDKMFKEGFEARQANVRNPKLNWPKDAYLLNAYDVLENAESFMRESWVADPCADPRRLDTICQETCKVSLGTWIGSIKNLSITNSAERLSTIDRPTLIIWATQDNVFSGADQEMVINALRVASNKSRGPFFFKTYGKQPLPASGMQVSDLGHNTHWGAPDQSAADIASFIRSNKPTDELPYADPRNPQQIISENSNSSVIKITNQR